MRLGRIVCSVKRTDISIDVWHHLVYAVAAGPAYELLDRRS